MTKRAKKRTMKRMYSVKAIWDEEARVFYCESDIGGLHVEAKTLDEFKEVVAHFALDLILSNHLDQADLVETPLRDLLPVVMLETQAAEAARARKAAEAAEAIA